MRHRFGFGPPTQRRIRASAYAICAVCAVLSLHEPVLAKSTASDSPPGDSAADMAQLDILLAKDAIAENWAAYTLLFDGDGVSDKRVQWADHTFTEDATWKWYDIEGKLIKQASGLSELRKNPSIVQQATFKHIPMALMYDEVTPTTAATRTIVWFVDIPKATVAGQADGVSGVGADGHARGVAQMALGVYHDTWRKVDGNWRKSTSALYSANNVATSTFGPAEASPATSTAASIQPPEWASDTVVFHGMSAVDVLAIKDRIRQRWADYSLMIDGDGISKDPPGWAADILGTDARWLWFDPTGHLCATSTPWKSSGRTNRSSPKPSSRLPASICL